MQATEDDCAELENLSSRVPRTGEYEIHCVKTGLLARPTDGGIA
jgi:hypothetical protein